MKEKSSAMLVGLLMAAAVAAGWIWWGWRIEPANGQVAVLMKKTGENLPAGEIIAPTKRTRALCATCWARDATASIPMPTT